MQHVVHNTIDAIYRSTKHLVGNVIPGMGLANVDVFLRVLQGWILRNRQSGRLFGKLSIAKRTFGFRVNNPTIDGCQFVNRDTKTNPTSRHQNRSGGCSGHPHASPTGKSNRCTAPRHLNIREVTCQKKGVLNHPPEEAREHIILHDEALDDVAVREGTVSRGLLNTNLRPRQLELLRDNLTQGNVCPLPHLGVGCQNHHRIVRPNFNPQCNQHALTIKTVLLVRPTVMETYANRTGAQTHRKPATGNQSTDQKSASRKLHPTVPAVTTARRMRS